MDLELFRLSSFLLPDCCFYYSEFTWGTWRIKSLAIQLLVQANNHENDKTQHYWTLAVESTCDQYVHDDAIDWKHFPRYWPFVQAIHCSLVNSPHKGQWCEALIFSLICVWINGWVKIVRLVIWDAIMSIMTSLLCLQTKIDSEATMTNLVFLI